MSQQKVTNKTSKTSVTREFDEKCRRGGAGVVIVQWQSGVPLPLYAPDLALAAPFWPKKP